MASLAMTFRSSEALPEQEDSSSEDRKLSGNSGNNEDQDNGNGGDGDGSHGDGDGGRDRVRWVTVATFSVPTEAHMARIKLEREDVDCLLVDEYTISTNWLLSPALGGIKLQVPEDQLNMAREVLATVPGTVVEWDESEAIAMATCKVCGDGEFAEVAAGGWMKWVSILFLGIPLLFLPRRWACQKCGAPMVLEQQ